MRAFEQGLRRDPVVLPRSSTVDQLRVAYFAALETYAAQMDLHPIAHDPAMVEALDGAASAHGMPEDGDGDGPDDDGDESDDPRLYHAVGAAYAAWKRAEAAPAAVDARPARVADRRRTRPPGKLTGWRRACLVVRQEMTRRGAADLLGVVRRSAQLSAVAVVLLAGALFLAGRAVGDTIAYFTTAKDVTGTSLATAKQFALTDVAAVAAPGGNIVLFWSGATWATNGYSVQRSAVSGGPYTEIGTTNASTFTFTDTTANGLVNGTTYFYVVRGKSALNGTGLNSNQASAKSDSTAPTVSSTTPANAATSVATNTTNTVNFSEAMSQALTVANFALVQCDGSACAVPGADVSGTTSWATATQLVFTPASNLAANTWFGIQLTSGSSGAADLAGNILSLTGCPHASGNDCYRTFRTTGTGVAAAVPPNGATNVGKNTNVSITFIGPTPSATDKTSLQNGFSLKRGATTITGTFTWVGTTMTFNPSANLANNATYTYTEVATTGDFNVNFSASFTTSNSTDTTGPTGTGVTPADTSTNQSPFTSVTMTFSAAMDPGVTAAAMSLSSQNPPSSTCPPNTGPGPLTVSGTKSWFNSTTLIFTPYSALSGGACYRVWVTQTAGGAADTAGNLLTGPNTATFTVGADMNISQTPSGYGTVFYPGGSGTATGGGWTAGSGNVTAKWDDAGTTQIRSAAPASGAVTIPLVIPSNATAGNHTITFNRSGGSTVTRAVTVRQPTSLTLRANPSDISAGGSTTLTATVYDNGQVAQNAGVSFSKVDPDARGTLGTPSNSGITDANGQVTITLSASAGGTFQNITVTATSGSASDSAVIVDPPPLPPSDLVLGAGPSGMTLSWRPSPSRTVAGYRVAVGTASGRYGPSTDVGSSTSYTYTAARPGTTY